jgi:hypothetical protein
MTSVVPLSAMVVGGAAYACDWDKMQTTASAAPAPEQQPPVEATKVDPQLLALLDKLAKETPPPTVETAAK